ncbi:MAG: GNAT family N-acetyltransferase [Clostridia bacterium]|nr:GNAT family N-acetyltransferase [Clostridia bacterium]
MNIVLRYIGKSADDLRFFILMDGQHAGGITVHSVNPPQFSYGIAIAKSQRRKGIAKAALPLLFEEMSRRGFSIAVVQIAPDNAASLALHKALWFEMTAQDADAVTMELAIGQP